MNKVILTGNLCKDIQLKYTQNNTPILRNTIAVKNNFKNPDGEYESEFINIVVWNKSAEVLKDYAGKGSKILVEGRITTRNYEKQDGTKVYITEVVAERIELLAKQSSNSTNSIKEQQDTLKEVINEDPFKEFGSEVVLTDDDLPF